MFELMKLGDVGSTGGVFPDDRRIFVHEWPQAQTQEDIPAKHKIARILRALIGIGSGLLLANIEPHSSN
jgi:hypothetical protein